MGWKKFALIALVLSFAFLQSCEDFLLKKTVSVSYLSGEIGFDPAVPSLSGSLIYTIRNKQKISLNEIYLISHELVTIDFITFQGEMVHFEEGLSYGLAIYRVRTPVLKSGEEARVEVRFRINGPVDTERFHISKDSLFMDAEKAWIPVPFAETWKFHYSITVKTPENLIPVLGAKLTSETVHNGKRLTVWESEIRNALITGNISIAPYQRVNRGNIWYYSAAGKPSESLFRYVNYSLSVLSDQIGAYPYTQLHIISDSSSNHNMEEFIDGEFLGNALLISPALTQEGSLESEETLSDSALPFVPENSQWKLFEVLAHEISHAYIGGILQFDEEHAMEQEALTEYTALALLSTRSRDISERLVWNNRFDLLNLSAGKITENRIWNYLFGVNTLAAAFKGDSTSFFRLLRTLLGKYSYTQISPREILSTAIDLNRQNTNRDGTSRTEGMIDIAALQNWGTGSLVNFSLALTETPVTNILPLRKITENRKRLVISSDAPVEIPLNLMFQGKDGTVRTNAFKIPPRSASNIPWETGDTSATLLSSLGPLEEKLYDNSVTIGGSNALDLLTSNVNLFYQGRENALFTVQSNSVPGSLWDSPFRDRDGSQKSSGGTLRMLADAWKESPDDAYLSCWKTSAAGMDAYVLFRFIKFSNQMQLCGVLDPALR